MYRGPDCQRNPRRLPPKTPVRYIGLPTAPARYQVLHSCLEELVRVGIVAPPSYLPPSFSKAIELTSSARPPPSLTPSPVSSADAAAAAAVAAAGPTVLSPPLEASSGRTGPGIKAGAAVPSRDGGGGRTMSSKEWDKRQIGTTEGVGAGLDHPGSNAPVVNGNNSNSSGGSSRIHEEAMVDGGGDVVMSAANVSQGEPPPVRCVRARSEGRRPFFILRFSLRLSSLAE